jgi:hypothetical protein
MARRRRREGATTTATMMREGRRARRVNGEPRGGGRTFGGAMKSPSERVSSLEGRDSSFGGGSTSDHFRSPPIDRRFAGAKSLRFEGISIVLSGCVARFRIGGTHQTLGCPGIRCGDGWLKLGLGFSLTHPQRDINVNDRVTS